MTAPSGSERERAPELQRLLPASLKTKGGDEETPPLVFQSLRLSYLPPCRRVKIVSNNPWKRGRNRIDDLPAGKQFMEKEPLRLGIQGDAPDPLLKFLPPLRPVQLVTVTPEEKNAVPEALAVITPPEIRGEVMTARGKLP